jgi:GNAT superfamily N-acetyltransferase
VSLPDWTEAPLARHHDRKAFDCGEPALNEYLARYARQNHESGGAKTFIASPVDEPSLVLGYYTLAPASLAYARVPSIVTRGLGRYEVPVFRLGRLAVDRSVQGQGLGGRLLLAAGIRCLAVAEQVGGVALLIDAKSERAAAWYRGYGAVALEDAPLSLVLPLPTIAAAVSGADALF